MSIDEKADDNALVDRIEQGDLNAFGTLYDRYASKVLKRCYFICLNGDQAGDLMQEVWIKVFLNVHSFKKEAAFSTWLYRLTTNHCLNYVKSKNLSEKIMQDYNVEEGVDANPALSADVKTLLQKLSWEDRRIMAMKFMGGYTYEEISEICDIGISAAKMKVSRLLTKLREEV